MAKTIHSGNITFIDLTDSKKVDVHIASNLPTTQIFDGNAQTYSPDWTKTPLELSLTAYADSTNITTMLTNNDIVWYRQVGSGDYIKIQDGGTKLTISNNDLRDQNIGLYSGVVSYICVIKYNNKTFESKLTFARVDSGINGAAGKDGTSVNIEGTAYCKDKLTDTYIGQEVDLWADATFTSLLAPVNGSSYIVQGYLCVYDSTNGKFTCAGTIQGPQGVAGKDAKNLVLTADAQVFKASKSTAGIAYTPNVIKVTAQRINVSSETTLTWYYNGSINTPDGLSRTGDVVTITGSALKTDAVIIKVTDGDVEDIFTVYRVFDGADGSKGADGQSASMAFLTNENVTFSADANGNIASTRIVTEVVAYHGTTKITPSIKKNADGSYAISGLPTGMTYDVGTAADNEIPIAFVMTNNASVGYTDQNNGEIKIPVIISNGANNSNIDLILSWSKVNSGAKGDKGDQGNDGVGINSVTVSYGTSTSTSTQPTSWQSTIPTVAEGAYLWTRTITDYTDVSMADTVVYTYAKQGAKGATGSAGTSVTVSKIEYQASTSATTAPTGTWSTSVVTVAEGSYLWTKTTFSDGKIAYGVAKQGAKGDKGVDAVTFQVYAPNGYVLTKDLQSLTLQTFAYEGSTAITSGATFQWSQLVDNVWTTISGATGTTLTVAKTDVLKAKSYRCVMTYKSNTYTATATVQDKTDTYNSIMCISSNATNNDCYWVLYTLVYNDSEEVDPLLGPISTIAPTSPVSGDYWYAVDSTNATVTLKKYNGTSWANSTDTQSLSYYWDLINDGSTNVPLGASSKVKVVSCHDFTATATLVCEVSNIEDGLLTQSSLSITDASDPIVSADEPTATVNGQIWIKPNSNGTYLMFVWDASLNNWISSDMDTRSKVYTSRPTSYNVGDLWITASDADHGSYLHGTLLQAQKSNTVYNAADWSPTLRYDQDIDDMKETLNNLSQYVTITSAGLRIGARNTSGELSPFTSLFTSTELSFYQNSEKLLTLANNKLTAPRIEVEDDLVVQGSISLRELKLIIESNGSFSFAVQK